MTVKELIKILQQCNEDYIIVVQAGYGPENIVSDHVWAVPDSKTVIINLDYEVEK